MAEGFWVFGYGSLMWRPGFPYLERCRAELTDHRRNFCLDSIRYRGTPEYPGLVLALEPSEGSRCRGVAFRVCETDAVETREYLRQRELVTRSYHEKLLPLTLDDERRIEGICYVIDRSHRQYRSDLSLKQKAQIIARAVGPAGANSEYLFNTYNDLKGMLVEDSEIEALVREVSEITGKEI